MISLLKGCGAMIGAIGVGVGINYQFAKPIVDPSKVREEQFGHPVSPLPFPSDMETSGLEKWNRWPIRLINSLGDTYLRFTGKDLFPLVNKDNKEKLKELKKLLNPEEFKRFEHGYEKIINLYNAKWGASPTEFVFNNVMLTDYLNARLAVEKSFLEPQNQKVLEEEKLKPQIIITGQPRTGSTFLHHLLGMDPNCRFLTEWEQMRPIPYPNKENYTTDSRAEQFRNRQKKLDFFVSNIVKYFRSYHDHDGSGIEEEYFLLGHTMLFPLPICLNNVPYSFFLSWLQEPRFDEYKYMKKFLLMNQHYHPPKNHWVLKTPLHGLYFTELMEVFDDAAVIVTHRDPMSTVPSLSKLAMFIAASLSRDLKTDVWFCKEEHGTNIIKLIKPMVDVMSLSRKKNPQFEERILDIEYSDLIRDPMEVVREIYRFAKVPLSPESEKIMVDYLEKDKEDRQKGKKGSKYNPYTLGEFGLSEEMIDEAFYDYRRDRGYTKR